MTGKIALIIVDVQNDFLEKGSLAVPDSNVILEPVNQLMIKIKQLGGLVIATQDWHPNNHVSFASNNHKPVFSTHRVEYEGQWMDQIMWPDHCVQNSRGAELSDALDKDRIDYFVKKGLNPQVDSYSAFADNNYSEITELAKILYQHNIDTVYVVGLATDYCVKFTCLDAIKFGFDTVLLTDCTSPVDSIQLEATLNHLKSKGVKMLLSSDVK
ncbi:Pyrazinamidase/nicotinamidase [Choanephora cucurbitarum]|uniref:nicotinamidase n=1 Tax=Choanephora cucurbitarum TaxID=101091 RepID=A0A1C7N7R1_9FUNG|nr:Pyrazinamidase/nicotinamidase [Choanephora cucurbitarum]